MECDCIPPNKQAYLIIAHKEDLVFRTLLQLLDDPRNDIFIHMDKKNSSYDAEKIEGQLKKSNIYHTERTSVSWGGYSLVNAELLLLKKAVSVGRYQHYHLLSGADLPLKSQDDIVAFFEANEGKEFIRFEKENFTYRNRVQYFYPFQEMVGRGEKKLWSLLNGIALIVQKTLKMNRNKQIIFQKGTQWFSITDSLARYVVEQESWIQSVFHSTLCCDEVFLQTIVNQSNYRDRLYHREYDNDLHAIMRYIDWERGCPYVFTLADMDELLKSGMMFARKFDEQVDKKIIIELANLL